jgi:hypothetical protein
MPNRSNCILLVSVTACFNSASQDALVVSALLTAHGDTMWNTAVVINNTGKVLGKHRKVSDRAYLVLFGMWSRTSGPIWLPILGPHRDPDALHPSAVTGRHGLSSFLSLNPKRAALVAPRKLFAFLSPLPHSGALIPVLELSRLFQTLNPEP